MKKKKLSQVLQVADPNLKFVSPCRKKQIIITDADWARLSGVNCSTCGKELLKTYGPLKQCRECLTKLKDIMLEETDCPKCSKRATKATTFSGGLLDAKIVCPWCGTFPV